jgi:hypothetical protein
MCVVHLTLKLEATRPAASNFLEQQGKFDDFIEIYNSDRRPHQALDSACRPSAITRPKGLSGPAGPQIPLP